MCVLTHNRLQTAQRLIEQIEGTLPRDVELLILDNGSTDGTAEFVADLPDLVRETNLRVFLEAENLGVAGGRNALVKQLDEKVRTVIFLDEDVIVEDVDWIVPLRKALEAEEIGIAGPAGSYIEWTDIGAKFHPADRRPCDVVSGWCFAVKREVFELGATFDEAGYGLFWEEDSDFCLQARDVGFDVVCTGPIGLRHEAAQSGDKPGARAANLARFREIWHGLGLIRAEGGY